MLLKIRNKNIVFNTDTSFQVFKSTLKRFNMSENEVKELYKKHFTPEKVEVKKVEPIKEIELDVVDFSELFVSEIRSNIETYTRIELERLLLDKRKTVRKLAENELYKR